MLTFSHRSSFESKEGPIHFTNQNRVGAEAEGSEGLASYPLPVGFYIKGVDKTRCKRVFAKRSKQAVVVVNRESVDFLRSSLSVMDNGQDRNSVGNYLWVHIFPPCQWVRISMVATYIQK